MESNLKRLFALLRAELDNGNTMEAGATLDEIEEVVQNDTPKDGPMDITVTPWKPKEGAPILLRIPPKSDKEISSLVEMFLVGDIYEVRWQHGHVRIPVNTSKSGFASVDVIVARMESYDGNGHYVHR